MKTIFITSFHSLISRNILQTEILPILIKSNVRVVLIVPEQKISFYKKHFGNKSIIIKGVSIPKKRFENILYFISLSLVGVNNHIVDDLKTERRYLKYYLAHSVNLLSRFFFLHKFLRFITKVYLRVDTFDLLFTQYQPNLVFATDIFYREDRALVIEAKRRNISAIGMVRSWDNATTKGVLLSVPNYLITPNNVLKEEMVSIHKVPAQKITITGVPHYDLIKTDRTTREEFFEHMGLDPKKKTILFAPGGKILYKHDGEILAYLKKCVDSGAFNHPVQFLVRFPPGDTGDTQSVNGDVNFVIDHPGINVSGRKKDSEMTVDENDRLNDSIMYSDVVVTLVSTMVIDGTVFQKPVVVLSFEPKEELVDSIHKFIHVTHFKKLLNSQLVTVSRSSEEFVAHMNEYLDNPEKNKPQRDALIAQYAHVLDGNSARRVTEILLSYL